MLILYMKPTCPFSRRVIETAEGLGVELELKDITESEEYEKELMELGGKHQTPFFVDEEHGFSCYESQDIIDHLREKHAGKGDAAPKAATRVHVGGSTCISCEG